MFINALPRFFQLTFKYVVFGSLILRITKNKFDKKKIFTFALILTFISMFFYLTNINLAFITPTLEVLLILIGNLFIFKLNMPDSLISSSLCSIINFIISTISMLINPTLFQETYPAMQTLLLSVLSIFLYKISYTPLFKFFIAKIEALPENKNEIAPLVFLIILSFNPSALSNNNLVFIIFTIQLIALLCEIYIIYKKVELNEINLQFDAIAMQNYSMQCLLDNVRTFKHDYNNTLCAIGGYIALNDIKGLQNFYSRLNFDMHATNNIQLINATSINEPSIYNIISAKHKLIVQNNIKFDFYSSINYKALAIPPYEISKILGILLDNAIEAALLSNEKEISMACKNYKNSTYLITIKNSYKNKDVNIDEIYKKGTSSKKVKSGLGLWEVSKIIDEFPDISLSTTKSKDYFIQALQIPTKELS